MATRKAFLTISESAADRLKYLLGKKESDSNLNVKVGVKKRGCNGLSYTMNYVEKPEKFDETVEQHGLKVFIDSKALMILVGTRMDYVEDDIRSEFVFENPNSKGSCGCGESFHI